CGVRQQLSLGSVQERELDVGWSSTSRKHCTCVSNKRRSAEVGPDGWESDGWKFVAFLVAYHQNKQLIGEKGLLPCKLYLQNVKRYFKGKIDLDALSYAPTIIWFLDWSDMDSTLDYLSLFGLATSAFVLITGCANMVLMSIVWVLYLSLVNVGQIWYSFGK
uniref:Lipase maturation factor 1 n=1 Tax=Amazona collaria TaxID=241587 RepID=A0A8B9IYZ3_9PSIT